MTIYLNNIKQKLTIVNKNLTFFSWSEFAGQVREGIGDER